MPAALSKTVAGFIAGALATAIFHQGMYYLMQRGGLPLQGAPWNMAPNARAFGLPALANQMFWGGLWGVLFAFLYARLPTNMGSLKGVIFGVIFPLLLGSWLIVASIRGQPLLADFAKDWNVLRLRNGFLLNGIAFGLGLGLLYPLLAGLFGARAADRA
jgi:hypothetical protein